ncbi:putative late blight resistance protein homolog R1A-4 [Solanum stenotomum]|uniref:putative late blight resistance protein homolog R1A-4 n=1 Tax=Solanum stenotomum TaxID=172797 RepID=UPI0020D0A6BB|nr:putative late blight resistance protein homolog R1A-4 [Solanum stenotomum]XP_049404981.1 putative late blight resistance protein homolog R1A-4 [Solanum stenotomum]
MAQKCRAVIGAIDFLKGRHLDINQLDDARTRLECLSLFLAELEEVFPENTISTQLGALFQQAHDGFSEICNPMTKSYTKALKIIKLEASKPSISTRKMILEVLKKLRPWGICRRIRKSNPSTSSRQIITMEMVRFVNILLDYVQDRTPEFSNYLRPLQAIFTLTASWCIEHENMRYFFIHVENLAYTALELCVLTTHPHYVNSEWQESMSVFDYHFGQIDKSLLTALKSSRSETTLKSGCMVDVVNALREDLEVHPSHVRIQSLEEGLLNISKFLLEYTGTQLRIFSSLQSLIEVLVFEAAFLINSYDEDLVFVLKPRLSHVNVVVELIQLRNSQATMTDLIDYALEELIVVTTFLMDSLEQCKQQPKITDLLTLIQSVTNEACSAIKNLLCHTRQEDLVWEMNRSHFQLLLKFNFIKAAIRQMCSTICASLTEIHLLNFLPINFEVIGSYLNSSKKSVSGHDNMDLVMMGFHEYIIDNLLLKHETDLSFPFADDVKKFYDGLLLLLTYLLDPLFQCSGFGTFAIEAESVNSNKSRKGNLVLQFLTVAFKLIECERSFMDLVMIESSHEELIYLRVLLIGVLRQHTILNEFHNVLKHAEVTANKMAQIIKGRSIEETGHLLSEIESVNVEVRKVCFQFLDASPYNMTDGEGLIRFLLHQDWLLNFDACSIPFLKNQIPVIKDKLFYLGSFIADIVQHRDMHQELKDLVKHVQDIKFVCLFPIRDNAPSWCYRLYLSDVKQLLKFVETEVETICLKVPDSSSHSFPKINELGSLYCFLGKLDEMLSSKINSVIDLKLQIGSVKKGLLCLRTLTDHFPEINDEHDEVYSLITRVTATAYEAEYVIDSCLTYSYPLWYKVCWISEAVEKIKLVNEVVRETCERKKIDVTVHKVKKTSTYLVPSLSANTEGSNEEMESFQEAMDQMKKQLLGGSRQLDVISLVGMPGIGKTTLAEKIYNDPVIISCFDVRAQCRMTQAYSWRGLLLSILNGVLEPIDRNEKEDGELADELRRFLLTKRFLILIDDVWDDKVWDNIHMCFKDARNGSRIILTTRLSSVANYAKCESEPHHLRLFRDDESWTLLQQELFQGKSCPPEIVDVGFRIAKICGGLPLFIVLVAGVLKEKKLIKAELWKEIEESLCLLNIDSLEESMSIIGFSYRNLPQQLKPCFLYFGGLLKGKDIHVSKLTWLWVAEGFVQANEEKGLEDAAECLLEDLISRNLVMGVEKRPNGKLKTCRVHDLLHKFCLEKSKQENFLLHINGFTGEDSFPEMSMDYRLFVHSSEDQIDLWQPSRSNVRSLLFNVIDSDNLLWPHDISFIFDSFKLVKVLDLESVNIGGTFPSEIQFLIHLKYFAAKTGGNSIPSCIANLWNLKTFVIRGLGGEVILPNSLLKMVKIRNIHVTHRASFSLHENIGESLADSQLDNLETFSTPHFSYGEDTDMILRKMPKLRKLSCIFSGTFGYSEKVTGRCVLYPRLEFLCQLESLKVVSNSYPGKLPHVFSFPSKLRELTLSKFRLPWSQILSIGELPNLKILRLLLRTFEGDEWEVKNSEFRELKYLELENLNIAQWSVSKDAFPILERLVLTKCKRLKKIPSHFDDAVSLKSIEVNWCSWYVANSAQEIQVFKQDELANDVFKVTIQPPDWDRNSSP